MKRRTQEFLAAKKMTPEAELKAVYENLTDTQIRCNELLEDARSARAHAQALGAAEEYWRKVATQYLRDNITLEDRLHALKKSKQLEMPI